MQPSEHDAGCAPHSRRTERGAAKRDAQRGRAGARPQHGGRRRNVDLAAHLAVVQQDASRHQVGKLLQLNLPDERRAAHHGAADHAAATRGENARAQRRGTSGRLCAGSGKKRTARGRWLTLPLPSTSTDVINSCSCWSEGAMPMIRMTVANSLASICPSPSRSTNRGGMPRVGGCDAHRPVPGLPCPQVPCHSSCCSEHCQSGRCTPQEPQPSQHAPCSQLLGELAAEAGSSPNFENASCISSSCAVERLCTSGLSAPDCRTAHDEQTAFPSVPAWRTRVGALHGSAGAPNRSLVDCSSSTLVPQLQAPPIALAATARAPARRPYRPRRPALVFSRATPTLQAEWQEQPAHTQPSEVSRVQEPTGGANEGVRQTHNSQQPAK